jgi:hypothetical protein
VWEFFCVVFLLPAAVGLSFVNFDALCHECVTNILRDFINIEKQYKEKNLQIFGFTGFVAFFRLFWNFENLIFPFFRAFTEKEAPSPVS